MLCNPGVEGGFFIPTADWICPSRLSAQRQNQGHPRVPDVQRTIPMWDKKAPCNGELSAEGGFTPPVARLDNYSRNIQFNGLYAFK